MVVPSIDHMAFAQFKILITVPEFAINAACMAYFPFIPHEFIRFRQVAQIVIVITGGKGHFIKQIVQPGIAASNIRQ